MKESTFITQNQPHWKALENYNATVAKKGLSNLGKTEVQEFARLFRLASHNLAYAKTHYPQSHVLPYLNKVIGVTHNLYYVRESTTFSSILKYFTTTFPREVRDTHRYWLTAAALLFLGVFFAGIYVAMDVSRFYQVMPAQFSRGFDTTQTPDMGQGVVPWEHTLMAATITTNNIAVTFNAFVGGLLAGIGTVFILIYNGVIIGGLFGFFHAAGADMVVAYALVLPHGVMELMAIFLGGGCGLILAKGLLIPGELTRKESLILAGKKAMGLLPGIVVLLIIAGIIEGYFTPAAIDPWLKLAFAAFTGLFMLWYFSLGWRKDNA